MTTSDDAWARIDLAPLVTEFHGRFGPETIERLTRETEHNGDRIHGVPDPEVQEDHRTLLGGQVQQRVGETRNLPHRGIG